MICIKCGAANAETVFTCGRCGAPLVKQPGFPMAMNPPDQSFASNARGMDSRQPMARTEVPASSLFAPIAHSPFSEEPLPQASDALPTLIQPAGDILVFTPTAEMPASSSTTGSTSTPPEHVAANNAQTTGIAPSFSWDLADYPTETRVPALEKLTPDPQPFEPMPPFSAQTVYEQKTFAGQPYPDVNVPQVSWPGSEMNWPGFPEENHAAFFQAPPASQPLYPGARDLVPVSQPLGNVYPGLPADSTARMLPGQGLAAFPSGSLRSAGGEHQFVRPLPLWATLAGTAAGVLLLVALVFLNADWASGATIASMVAIILALLLLIAGGVRVALGLLAETNPRRRSQVISTVSLVLLLFLFSGIGLTQQTSLHAMQARYLEGQHSWQTAISEYQAAGETAPASENLARSYVEWGEALEHQQQYGSAVTKFSTVLNQYPQATAQLSRARSDLVAAYLAWASSSSQRQDYAGATSHYDALLALNFCDSACQSLALPKDATAYDHLAEQQLNAQQFAPAVAAFKTLTTRFASSPEAQQVHADYAKALWGMGQQQVKSACANAIPTYQQLAKQFADTSQGQQAATALKQPVQATGHFTQDVPGAPFTPTAYLVQGLSVGIQQYQFPSLLRAAPTTRINSDGTFAFSSVPPGAYELVWSSDALHFYYAFNGSQVLYTAQVGPLCAYNFGDINQAIPTTGN